MPYAVAAAIGGLCFWFYRAWAAAWCCSARFVRIAGLPASLGPGEAAARRSTAHSNRVEALDAIEDEKPLAADELEELRDLNAAFLGPDRFAAARAGAP